MKKLVFMFVAMAAVSFAACKKTAPAEAADSTKDSAAVVEAPATVDSAAACCDSAAACCDSACAQK